MALSPSPLLVAVPWAVGPQRSRAEKPRLAHGAHGAHSALGCLAAVAAVGRGLRIPQRSFGLQRAVELLQNDLKVEDAEAQQMVKDIQKFAVARNGEDINGGRSEHFTRKLLRGLKVHQTLEPMLKQPGGVEMVLAELESRSEEHSKVFKGIAREHAANRSRGAVDMEEYSAAAEYMSNEWWVRRAHERMIKRIDQYFLLSSEQAKRGYTRWAFPLKPQLPEGWKQYKFQGKTMYWNPETNRMQTQVPPGVELREAPPAREGQKVRLLDIGGSVNRFGDWPELVQSYSLDLQPAKPEVLQGDFFEVPIVDGDAADEPVILGEDGSLQAIVEGSFDVVVLSLVLSFLESPERRIEMVSRARRCLKHQRGLLLVVEGVSTVAEGQWHQKDGAAEWSLAMESAGFKALLFEDEVRAKRRCKKVLQWILETKPDPRKALQPLVVAKEMEW